jgi:hypothetical protein
MMQPFVVRRHGRNPSNSRPDLDFSVIETEEHFQPRIEAPAAGEGDYVCAKDDLIRNAAHTWSLANQPAAGVGAHGSDDVSTALGV